MLCTGVLSNSLESNMMYLKIVNIFSSNNLNCVGLAHWCYWCAKSSGRALRLE